MQLFETETPKWTGSVALVPLSSLVCVWCGPTFDVTYQQPALLRHGGYGETLGVRVRACRCGAINTASRFTVNPRANV